MGRMQVCGISEPYIKNLVTLMSTYILLLISQLMSVIPGVIRNVNTDRNREGLIGYNVQTKKFESTWTDTVSTGINLCEGEGKPTNEGLNIELSGKSESGQKTKCTLNVADNKHTFASFSPTASGGWWQNMRITYIREQ